MYLVSTERQFIWMHMLIHYCAVQLKESDDFLFKNISLLYIILVTDFKNLTIIVFKLDRLKPFFSAKSNLHLSSYPPPPFCPTNHTTFSHLI